MNTSIFFLALRRMRVPLIVLIVLYAVSTLGLTLVPGIDAQGRPAPPMSFFHAFYFVSYTATTIGFGEIPAKKGRIRGLSCDLDDKARPTRMGRDLPPGTIDRVAFGTGDPAARPAGEGGTRG